jgi:hypothetical protein
MYRHEFFSVVIRVSFATDIEVGQLLLDKEVTDDCPAEII